MSNSTTHITNISQDCITYVETHFQDDFYISRYIKIVKFYHIKH